MPIESKTAPPAARPAGGVGLGAGDAVPLNESAMLVGLKITGWDARKKDKRVTKQTAEEHHVSEENLAVWKKLIAKSEINKVRAAAQAGREVHYKNTLPWVDDGSRILPSRNFKRYREELRAARANWDKVVNEFIRAYPGLVEQARRDLNGMFDERNYPTAEEIVKKFTWTESTDPVPASGDFRVAVADTERERIRAEIEERQKKWLADSSGVLWQRLYGVVRDFAKAMTNPKQKLFRPALVENMLDLCSLLPDLNVGNDLELEKLRRAVEADLCTRPVGDYAHRTDGSDEFRKEAAKAAVELLGSIADRTEIEDPFVMPEPPAEEAEEVRVRECLDENGMTKKIEGDAELPEGWVVVTDSAA